jgi:hypothetical protein
MPHQFLTRVLVAAFLVCVPAYAGLIGSNADIVWLYPDSNSILVSQTVAVGPGIEVTCGTALPFCDPFDTNSIVSTFDIDDSTVTLGFSAIGQSTSDFGATAFNGYDFRNLTGLGTITGFALNTDFPGFTSSRVSFTPSSIAVNMQGLLIEGTSSIQLQLITDQVAIPEPSGAQLMTGGIALLTALVFRRRTQRRDRQSA